MIRWGFLILTTVSLLTAIGCGASDQTAESDLRRDTPRPGPREIRLYDFEDGLQGWTANPGIELSQTSVDKLGGQIALSLQGSAPAQFWNYAGSNQISILPNRQYRLTGWLLVKNLDPVSYPPFLKCGLEIDGVWAANFNSEPYDMNRVGEWQLITLIFKTTGEPGLTGYISVEKGTNEIPVTAHIILDEVKLEEMPDR